ncbi:MAG: ATP-dependent RecD-like DNA helicase [Acholeplasmataceae bacterium]|nr:ATP-dependent RecD-like DNA helicase [Acholeplasmataceae bacterium]
MEEVLYGTVTKVIYYSEETHFCVLRIKLDYQDRELAKYKTKLFTNLLTVTGNFDCQPLVDEIYDFYGEFITNQYGMQFKTNRYSHRNEKSLEAIIAYLSSDLFPGVGKVAATKIYQELGNDCLTLIEKDPHVLDRVPGLNTKQKECIYTNLSRQEMDRRLLIALMDLGITMRTALKLIKIYGDNAYETISENPYQLIDAVEGFGFNRADQIALNLGIAKNSEIRLKALVYYLLKELTFRSGNSYLLCDELFQKASDEVNINEEIFSCDQYFEILKKLIIEKKIVLDEEKNVYTYQLYYAESLLAQKVFEFLNHKIETRNNSNDIEQIIEKIAKNNDITYTKKQKDAIVMALKESISIITGGPGTGKSTIIRAIIEAAVMLNPSEQIREKIALLAPTGRAAKRLKEVTKFNAQTIHKFLGYEGFGIYRNGPEAKVDAKIVIVDEFSMVDIQLAARLFASLEDDVRLILIGDVDQLPSVEPGQVLFDLISSKEIKTIRLDQIHRQAEDSTIISLAHSVNQGFVDESIIEKQHDRNFLAIPDQEIISSILKVVEQAMDKGMDLIRDIQVLVPMYKGELGINAINQKMQEKFNPDSGQSIKHMSRVFRVNDKVIQLVNRSEKKVMNGDIGYILNFNYENGEYTGLTVMFDFGPVDYQKDELEDLNHAYAISVHKSQGSEFDLVVMPFTFRYYLMLKRKLIYTGITRAKKFLVMLGNIEAFTYGIRGLEEGRRTKLTDKIKYLLNGNSFAIDDNFNEMENLSPYDFMD